MNRRKILNKIIVCILTVFISTMMMTGTSSINSLPSVVIVDVDAATIKLNKTTLTLTKGKTATLKISGTSKKVTWSSSKKSVATVNSSGKVTAKKAGTATITAKVNNKKYTCKVTVKDSTSTTVYITNTGKCYHKSGCRYLKKSKIAISKSKAKSQGYKACSVCNP